jgi:hypothetical protein
MALPGTKGRDVNRAQWWTYWRFTNRQLSVLSPEDIQHGIAAGESGGKWGGLYRLMPWIGPDRPSGAFQYTGPTWRGVFRSDTARHDPTRQDTTQNRQAWLSDPDVQDTINQFDIRNTLNQYGGNVMRTVLHHMSPAEADTAKEVNWPNRTVGRNPTDERYARKDAGWSMAYHYNWGGIRQYDRNTVPLEQQPLRVRQYTLWPWVPPDLDTGTPGHPYDPEGPYHDDLSTRHWINPSFVQSLIDQAYPLLHDSIPATVNGETRTVVRHRPNATGTGQQPVSNGRAGTTVQPGTSVTRPKNSAAGAASQPGRGTSRARSTGRGGNTARPQAMVDTAPAQPSEVASARQEITSPLAEGLPQARMEGAFAGSHGGSAFHRNLLFDPRIGGVFSSNAFSLDSPRLSEVGLSGGRSSGVPNASLGSSGLSGAAMDMNGLPPKGGGWPTVATPITTLTPAPPPQEPAGIRAMQQPQNGGWPVVRAPNTTVNPLSPRVLPARLDTFIRPADPGGTAAPAASATGATAAARTAATTARALAEVKVELKSLDDLAQKFGVGVFQSMSKAIAGTQSFGKALKGVVSTLGQSVANDFINVGVAGILHPSRFRSQKDAGQAAGGGSGAGGAAQAAGAASLADQAGKGLTTLLTPMLGAGPAGIAAGAALAIGGTLLGGLLGHKKEREEEQFRAHLRALRQAQTEQLMNFTIVLPNGPINPNDPAWKEAVANTMRSVAGTRTGRVEFQTRR